MALPLGGWRDGGYPCRARWVLQNASAEPSHVSACSVFQEGPACPSHVGSTPSFRRGRVLYRVAVC